MEVDELAPGLWRWTAPHPDWRPDKAGTGGWEQDVASLYLEAPDALVLIDPLAPPAGTPDAERFWAALDRDVARLGLPVAVLVTVHWHLRSARELRARYGASPGVSVWSLPPVPAEHADVVTDLVAGGGETLPGGVLAHGPVLDESQEQEVALYLPAQRALAVGDLLIGTPQGLRIWWHDDSEAAAYRERVLPFVRGLLELPVERVLVPHGPPVLAGGREALAAAIESPPWRRPPTASGK